MTPLMARNPLCRALRGRLPLAPAPRKALSRSATGQIRSAPGSGLHTWDAAADRRRVTSTPGTDSPSTGAPGTERRRRDRIDAAEALLDDAFSYARSLAGDPPDWDSVAAHCTVGGDRSTWEWSSNGRTYRVHQLFDGTTSVEVVLA